MINAFAIGVNEGYIVIDAKSSKIYTDGYVFVTKLRAVEYVHQNYPDIVVF